MSRQQPDCISRVYTICLGRRGLERTGNLRTASTAQLHGSGNLPVTNGKNNVRLARVELCQIRIEIASKKVPVA